MNINHRFGIEIEFNTRAPDFAVVDTLRTAGLSATGTDRSTNPPGSWAVKYDGSIGRGWEIVSPVLTPAEMVAQTFAVGRAFKELRERGYNVVAGQRCGLHVHLSGIGEGENDVLANLAFRWCNFEDTFDLIQPDSRRRSNNSFCRSNAALFGYDVIARSETTHDRIRSAKHDRFRLIQTVSPDRYYKLNFQSLLRHGTVEFRHHSATVAPQKIIQWATFLSHFADTSAQAVRVWRRRPGPQSDRFRKLMRGVPMRTQAYLQSRITQLNGGTFPGEPVEPAAEAIPTTQILTPLAA